MVFSILLFFAGDKANIAFQATVLDGQSAEQLFTNSTAAWGTNAGLTWTEAGNIAVGSVLRVVDSLHWNAGGFFNYGDNAYRGEIAEFSLSNEPNLLVRGSGGYGGVQSSFWASLLDSALILSDQLVGTATGYFSSDVPSDFSAGEDCATLAVCVIRSFSLYFF